MNLIVVGTGFTRTQLTQETMAWIERADHVLYCGQEALTEQWIQNHSHKAENITYFNAPGKPRTQTYREMINYILTLVREGVMVCVALYGHPGVFAYPARMAIKQALEEGFKAKMLPGICATDCLSADLLFDPGSRGAAFYEASYMLARQPVLEPTTPLIIWQIGCLGNQDYQNDRYPLPLMPVFLEYLWRYYPKNHPVVIYEASSSPFRSYSYKETTLEQLVSEDLGPEHTMLVPALGELDTLEAIKKLIDPV